jgi:hypothetical protein
MSRGFGPFAGRLRGSIPAAVKFVAASVRQREANVPVADAGEVGG